MAAFLLVTSDGFHYWAAPGLLPLGRMLDLSARRRLALWDRKEDAQRAADALRERWGISLVPTLVTVPCRGK